MSALESLLQIDCKAQTDSAVSRISDSVGRAKASGIVLGLSGGLDSAVTAALCAKSCDTLAIIMPDSSITPSSETDDAHEVAKILDVSTKVIDIAPILAEFARHVTKDGAALGNARARIRMSLLYYHANTKNAIVAGTGDKSELLVGYFTKHGDGAADIFPVSTLYKVQVREMARHLGIPERIIQKKSAPHLWNNHGAEDELGMSYNEIDPILYCMIDQGMDDQRTSEAARADMAKVAQVRELFESSAHKRSGAA